MPKGPHSTVTVGCKQGPLGNGHGDEDVGGNGMTVAVPFSTTTASGEPEQVMHVDMASGCEGYAAAAAAAAADHASATLQGRNGDCDCENTSCDKDDSADDSDCFHDCCQRHWDRMSDETVMERSVTSTITATTTTPTEKKKSVRFKMACRLIRIPTLADLSEEEYKAVYFTRDDYQRIRCENECILQRMNKKGDDDHDERDDDGAAGDTVELLDGDDDYFRGLEIFLTKYALQRKCARSLSTKFVRHMRRVCVKNGIDNMKTAAKRDKSYWIRLQQAYLKQTKTSQRMAIHSASYDAIAAANVYRSSTFS
jgi:hypothetical protein